MNKSSKVLLITIVVILLAALMVAGIFISAKLGIWSSNISLLFKYDVQWVQSDKMYFLWAHDGIQGLYCYDATDKTTTEFVNDVQMSSTDCIFYKNTVYLIKDAGLYNYNLETGKRSESLKAADPFVTTLLYADDDYIWFQEYDALFRLDLKTKKQEKIGELDGSVCTLKNLAGNIYFAEALGDGSTLYMVKDNGKCKKIFHADFSIRDILEFSENKELFFVAESINDNQADKLYKFDSEKNKYEKIIEPIKAYYCENDFFYYFSEYDEQILKLNLKTEEQNLFLSDAEYIVGNFIIAGKSIYSNTSTEIHYYDLNTNKRLTLFSAEKTPLVQ